MKNSEKTHSRIAEILGLMEEKGRTKDWILDEIKRNRVKSQAKSTMNSFQILKKCPASFVSKLYDSLKDGDFDIDDVNSFTKLYNWFFTDIIASANPFIPTKEQLRKILVLNKLITNSEIFKKTRYSSVIVPTGDGMAIGFTESSEYPLRLAMELHRDIKKYNRGRRGKEKLAIRIGLDVGPVYVINDLNDQDNYWGPGIIMARRIMDTAGEMQIFSSKKFSDDTRKLSKEYDEIFHDIGTYSIKHNEQISISNIYGDGFGNKSIPKKTKLVNRQETQKDLQGQNSFLFNDIQIKLDVIDPKTMLAHHTWIWNVENISKETRNEIFYHIDGDSPKDFSEMNVKVVDEKGNKLEIQSLSVNKPYHKEFSVKFAKPIKPKQKNKIIKMEYDWEEPERNFSYRLATNCKRFRYKFSIPKGVSIKNRTLKVDTELGYKWLATPSPTIKFGPKFTTVAWEKKNIKAYDAYKFEW